MVSTIAITILLSFYINTEWALNFIAPQFNENLVYLILFIYKLNFNLNAICLDM